jgi:O-glycosyl hydrolase
MNIAHVRLATVQRFRRKGYVVLRSGRLLVLVLLLTAAAVAIRPTPALAADSVTITGTGTGRVFDGVGAISGGGGNSRLLIDYPEPYRGQILDYLFKPGYGAALQILKVEIGGDTNSTDGAESSHEHARGDLNCDRGYEWWLMQQAKARNPNIKLYGLAWGAPGFLGNGNFWSTDTVTYLLDWLNCAAGKGLTIDYLGGWNEKGYNKTFYENLHSGLRTHGYATRIVAADSDWSVADAMVTDPTFAASIDIVGAHYPCTYVSAMTSCSTTSNALATGKQLWASENGSEDYNTGGAPMARAINRGYLDAKMSSFINWPLIASIYPNLPFPTTALMVANQPWSGWFDVGKQLWATAHTTQVTQPGWRYIDSASGYFGGDRNNGSYVSYQAAEHSAYSVVAETIDASAARTVTFTVTGGLPAAATLHVWASNFRSNTLSDYFVRQPDVTPSGGAFTLTLQPGYVYSVTTTSGQGRATTASPPQAALGLPYTDSFDTAVPGREPALLSQQQGAFETTGCGGGRSGLCVRQMAPVLPITWDAAADPYTVLGSLGWSDYTVGVDALFEQSGAVRVLGRVGNQHGFNVSQIDAYDLQVADTGAWSIARNSASGTFVTLASGTAAPLGLNSWHRLAVSFQGSTITAVVDGVTVGHAIDGSYPTGQVGLSTVGYRTQEFDNLSVTPIGVPPVANAYEVVNRNSGKALSVDANGFTIQSTYTGVASQQWQLTGNGSGWLTVTNVGSGKVLDVPGASTSPGTQLEQWTANGGTNQQWQLRPNGDGTYQIYGRNAGLVAGVGGGSTAEGAAVVQWTPLSVPDQAWSLVPVVVPGASYAFFNHNSGLALDVNGESTVDGGLIIQWPYHAGNNQKWHFVTVGSGWYEVVNVNSGKALESPDTGQGTQLDQRTYSGATTQQWQLGTAPGGYYTLVNRATGFLADVTGASTAQGAAVIGWPANGGANQQWQLQIVS